jgi:hypothetical protein
MSMQSIVQLHGRWLAFGHDTVAVTDSRPRLEGPAWLFAEFEGGVSSVISLEGSPAHAVALIEKRLRADGMIDGEGKILIHKNRSMGAGYQSLFTAVPLELWQQTYAGGAPDLADVERDQEWRRSGHPCRAAAVRAGGTQARHHLPFLDGLQRGCHRPDDDRRCPRPAGRR